MNKVAKAVLVAGLLLSAPAWAQNTIDNLYPVAQFPLPDPATVPSHLWITQGGRDYNIMPTQLGYIYQGTQPPQNPYTNQLWWNSSTTPAVLQAYQLGAVGGNPSWVPLGGAGGAAMGVPAGGTGASNFPLITTPGGVTALPLIVGNGTQPLQSALNSVGWGIDPPGGVSNRLLGVGFITPTTISNSAVVAFTARGTAAAPSGLLANDQIFRISVNGFGATKWAGQVGGGPNAAMRFIANENWSDTAMGTRLEWWTTANGTIGEKLVSTLQQGLVIGNPSGDPGLGGLMVNQAATPMSQVLTNYGYGQPGTITVRSSGLANGAGVGLVGYGSGPFPAGVPWFWGVRARGSDAAPLPPQTGDILGALGFAGFGSQTVLVNGGVAIMGQATENWSATNEGALIQFQTTPNGTAAFVTTATLDGAGNLNITGGYSSGGTVGVTCTAVPTAGFKVTKGIVTTC